MRCLLIQHGWEAALDPFPGTMTDTDKTAALKTSVYKKAHSALLFCLDNKVLRKVNKEDSVVGVWLMLETLYMTKSLANKLYLKKLFTFYMHSGKKLSEHIDEFNKLIGDLANIDIDINDEDQALMLLTSLPSSYDNFVETLLYGRESLTLEDGSGIHSKGYDNGDLLMAVSRERFLEWIMDSGGNYHMTPRRDFLFDFKEFNGGTILLDDNRAYAIMGTRKVRVQMKDGSSFVLENVHYIPELKRNLISLGTMDREGYTMKLHNGRVKVIKGSLMVLSGTMKENCMYHLDGYAESGEASVSIQEKESLVQEFNNLCKESGIARHLTVAGTSHQNGLAKRMNRTLLNKVRCLLIQFSLPDSFWAEATIKAAYLINRSPSTILEKKTPMDLWSGHPANYKMLRIFGCVAYSHVNQWKLNPRAIKCIFLGYLDGVKGYRLWRKEVKFEVELQGSMVEPTMVPHTGENPRNEDEKQDEGSQQQNLGNYVLEYDRAKRTIVIPIRYRDKGNVSLSRPSGSRVEDDMAVYAFDIAEEEDIHEPIIFQEAINHLFEAKRTAAIPTRYRDEGNVSLSRPSRSRVEDDMAAYAFVIAGEEDTLEPLTF
ncbi:retrovirus-related pol polyprotein from transposon TNT 1-94 [Tanacetum coccineum]